MAIALSALPTDVAKEIEPLWAARVAVCSNASTYRMAPDVPLIIPEVNPDHLAMIERQRAERGWQGCLVTNPNCAAIGIVMALKPLHDAFGVKKVHAATLQAVSGAGYPGVASLDILDNIIPNIANGGEEAKIESEPRKLLGRVVDGRVAEAADRDQRAGHARAGDRRAHRAALGGVRAQALGRAGDRGAGSRSRRPSRCAGCPAPRRSRSSSGARPTGRSRAATATPARA